MAECTDCGASGDPKLFTCSYCEQQFCSDHRLPENHDCVAFEVLETPLEGEGPETTDRRSTWRKRIERVREKETKKWHRKAPDRHPGEKSSEPDVSDLPACDECHRLRSDLEELDGRDLCAECREEARAGDHDPADHSGGQPPARTEAYEMDSGTGTERLHGWDYEKLREEHRDDGRESLLTDVAVLAVLVAIVVAAAGLLVLL